MKTIAAHSRIVIKIGSALMVEQGHGVREEWLASLVDDVVKLRAAGKEVIIVSSGAIALGRSVMKLPKRALKLEEAQAAAAVGQIELAQAWKQALGAQGIQAAQVLLTLHDTENRRRYLNARQTLSTLLSHKCIPIINENDTVATAEIRYGDNDRLAARVASMMAADCLVLLSDIDGFYTAPPHLDKNAQHVPLITQITPEIEQAAGGAASAFSRGGMATKIEAAKIAMNAGCEMVIAKGAGLNPLSAVDAGAKCSWFVSTSSPVVARKAWIGGVLEPKGTLYVDEGAAKALQSGKSLLPAGVKRIDGMFQRGDVVLIRAEAGQELGRGLVAYDALYAMQMIGKDSRQIAEILGFEGKHELVHRDDLVVG